MDDDRKAETMSIVLQCKSLTAGYDKKAVVSDVNFEINSGEIVTIIGANGAGKSTLLKTVAGLLPIVAGEIVFDGKNLKDISSKEKAKNLSVLLTDKIHSDYMTCYDVIATGRYAYTNGLGVLTDEDKAAIEKAIMAVDIDGIRNQMFDKLSDGQKQRVMLARAICQEPKLIILDEPTSFLDIGYKIEIMSVLKNLAQTGIAVLTTMHDLDIARKVSDRAVAIKDGKVDKIGNASELFDEDYLCNLFGVDVKRYREFFN